jgi:carbon monoxide dehydrogenase subunit G
MIEVNRSYRFDVPQDRVWQILMDTKALALCIRAVESRSRSRDRAPLSHQALGEASPPWWAPTWQRTLDLAPIQSCGLVAEGKGRPGFVKGKAAIALTRDHDSCATTLSVAGEVQAGGAIARVGQRLIMSAARLMMDRFFKRLKALAEARAKGGAELDIAALEAAEVDSAEEYLETPADES